MPACLRASEPSNSCSEDWWPNQYTTVMLAIMTMNTWSTCAFFFVEPQWIFLIDAENWTEIGLSFVLDCCALQEKWRNDVPRAWLFRPVKTYYQYGSLTWAYLAQLGQLGPNLAQLGQLGPAHPNIQASKPPSLMRPRRDTRSANNFLDFPAVLFAFLVWGFSIEIHSQFHFFKSA